MPLNSPAKKTLSSPKSVDTKELGAEDFLSFASSPDSVLEDSDVTSQGASESVSPETVPSTLINPDNFITFEPKDNGISSALHLNLQPYIDSYKTEDKSDYHRVKSTLLEHISETNGGLIWNELLQCAIDRALTLGRLNPDEALLIQNSPLNTYMKENFIEIVKNVMDEAILGAFENGRSGQLELMLTLDLSSPDQIKMTLTDNGRGFPDLFLKKLSTAQGREAYITSGGSVKQDVQNLPSLFGGQGMGLRMLMAEILTPGDVPRLGYLKQRHEKPALSDMSLQNRKDGSGAEIQMITSRSPLKEKTSEASGTDPLPLLQSTHSFKRIKNKSEASIAKMKQAKEDLADLCSTKTDESVDKKENSAPKKTQ